MNNPNLPQTIFMVFYAILWGVVANAQPKWRAFNWPIAFKYQRTRRRLALAVLLLNLVPLVYFILVFLALRRVTLEGAWSPAVFQGLPVQEGIHLFLVLVAAHAPFAIHRLWIASLEYRPERYYYDRPTEERPVGVEPIWDRCGDKGPALFRTWWLKSLIVGLCYLFVCALAAASVGRFWGGWIVLLVLVIVAAICVLACLAKPEANNALSRETAILDAFRGEKWPTILRLCADAIEGSPVSQPTDAGQGKQS